MDTLDTLRGKPYSPKALRCIHTRIHTPFSMDTLDTLNVKKSRFKSLAVFMDTLDTPKIWKSFSGVKIH